MQLNKLKQHSLTAMVRLCCAYGAVAKVSLNELYSHIRRCRKQRTGVAQIVEICLFLTASAASESVLSA